MTHTASTYCEEAYIHSPHMSTNSYSHELNTNYRENLLCLNLTLATERVTTALTGLAIIALFDAANILGGGIFDVAWTLWHGCKFAKFYINFFSFEVSTSRSLRLVGRFIPL